MDSTKVVQGEKEIEASLNQICDHLLKRHPQLNEMVLVGIRTGGVYLAERLRKKLLQRKGTDLPTGIIDITLYRDDLNSPHGSGQPRVRTTEIGFDIDDKVIILVDDVLYTGRSTRAAMDALIDLGRPKAIRLAVLVERAGRELPIQADYAGCAADVDPQRSVQVNLVESDGKDEVIVE